MIESLACIERMREIERASEIDCCPLCAAPIGALGPAACGLIVDYPYRNLVTLVCCAHRKALVFPIGVYAEAALRGMVPFYAFRAAVGHHGFVMALWGSRRYARRSRVSRRPHAYISRLIEACSA